MKPMTITRRRGLLALAAAALPAPSAVAESPAPSGLTVLTVGGLVGAPNREAFDANRDRFFEHNNLQFKSAHTFDEGALAAFTQLAVTADAYGSTIIAKGPLLREVLAAAVPLGTATIARLHALDGYAAEIPLGDIPGQDWILATEIDGRPLAVGQFGPLHALRQLPSGMKKTEEESAKWVHSLYYIELAP